MLIFSNNEARLIEKISEGDNRAFTILYEKYRAMFYGRFNNMYSAEKSNGHIRYRFMKDDFYLDDLYQNSCLKLYNQICVGKIFVKDNKICIRDKQGNANVLSAKLGTYLISIGMLTLKEMQRGEAKYVDFDPFEGIITNPISINSTHIDPICELFLDPYFDDENKFALVRRIVEEMKSPCKEIFTYTYFSENGKKMKGNDIASKMGYANADVVKNQKSRCHKKFRDTYIKLANN